ncbi:hypothetical protein [Haloplanus halophilus]|uniref:hypothetical protein n=1 Tax=Haloplanus halophilus TaxID=2949993 RepID=UPI00203A61B2|nr:hypothetical protein [Haloplanus sp. GDY1]
MGEEIEASSIDVNRGNRILKAVTSGPEAEFVYLEGRFTHGDEIDVSETAEIVEVVSGNGMSNPVVRYLVPTNVYEGDS